MRPLAYGLAECEIKALLAVKSPHEPQASPWNSHSMAFCKWTRLTLRSAMQSHNGENSGRPKVGVIGAVRRSSKSLDVGLCQDTNEGPGE